MHSLPRLHVRSLGAEPLAQAGWNAPVAPACPLLSGDHEADIAIVGAGLTGLFAALTASASGKRIAILEAREAGDGASGRNAGHVAPMMWGMKKTPAQMALRFGEARAQRMNRAIAEAGADLRAFLREHAVAFEGKLEGYVITARTGQTLEKTHARFEAWRAYGGRFEALTKQALSRYVASDFYAGGILIPDAGALNPVSLIRGLTRAALDKGVSIYANTPATGIGHDGANWTLTTPQGSLRAHTLLIATGAYGGALYPALNKQAYEVYSAILASEPLHDHGRAILPGGLPMADLDDAAIFAPVVDAHGRLLVSLLFQGEAMSAIEAERIIAPRLARAFPQLGPLRFSSFWGGKFLMTPDGAPHLLRLGPNGFAALGCNGMGYTLGFAAARDLGRLAAGACEDDLTFALRAPMPAPMHGLVSGALRHVLAPMMNRKLA